MNQVVLRQEDVRKLLGSGDSDAALLYLHIKSGGNSDAASLGFSPERLRHAKAALQQLGLLSAPPMPAPAAPQPPVYTETDVLQHLQKPDGDFQKLRGEVQRRYGRVLSTEELKCLITMTDYLTLPTEVVGMLLSYCIERSRRCGAQRMPALRTVEREAFRWADEKIDTIERAAAYMQQQLLRYSRMAAIAGMLQISGRKLTPGEEKYIFSWLDMGFGEPEIQLAYRRTLESLGQFKWGYINTILKNWDAAGLHTLDQIRQEDVRPQSAQEKRNSQFQHHGQNISPLGQQAIQKMLEEES